MSSNTSSTKPMPAAQPRHGFLPQLYNRTGQQVSAACHGCTALWNPTLLMFAPCAGTIRRRVFGRARAHRPHRGWVAGCQAGCCKTFADDGLVFSLEINRFHGEIKMIEVRHCAFS